MLPTTVLAFAGCADARPPVAPEDENLPSPGFFVSEARISLEAGVSSTASAEEGVAYVSVAPGTLTDAMSVRLRNVTAGDVVGVPVTLREGGFDPVKVSANPGDLLELAMTQVGGAITSVTFVVPVRRPPVVVRTSPPKGRTDVALSIRPLVVFSEPLDPQSLGPTSVQLLRGGMPVNGTAEMVAGSPFMVEFIPAGPLEPSTDYELVVTREVRDRDGDPLLAAVRLDFSTLPDDELLDLGSVRLVFTRGPHDGLQPRNLWSMNADGSAASQLTDGAFSDYGPAVSPDGSRIAFSRYALEPGIDASSPTLNLDIQIFVMNADGTGITQLTSGPTDAYWPSWSPDGSRIAFHTGDATGAGTFGNSIEIIRADGTGRQVLATGNHYLMPAWSPDGSVIAFFRDGSEEIWAVDTDGGNLRLVKKFVTWGSPPWVQARLAWTSEMKILVVDYETGVWTMDADGSNLVRRIHLNRGDLQFTGWSRDGKLLALDKLWGVNPNPDPLCICPVGHDIHLLKVADGSLTRASSDSVSYGAGIIP
jgi:hypothetical protein